MATASTIVSLVLAAIFVGTGLPKAALTQAAVRQLSRIDVPPAVIRVAGTTELLGAAGLVVGVWVPWVGALAAGLLVAQMVLAASWHLRKHDDAPRILPPLILLVLSAVALVLRLASA
jgi:uncharacterized membrane protein YphA (DoxX/SURF4 family)